MKIAVMGTQCIGKSAYIKDFIQQWPMYTTSQKVSYVELIESKGIKLNEEGNEESQKIILDALVDQVMYAPKDGNVIFDRSVLDNLVYTMWLNAKGAVSDKFVKDTITIVKETLTFYDILFFLPITKFSPITFTPAPNRSNSEEYRKEIDNIFKSLVQQYYTGGKTYFPFDHKLGCPAIVEIFGNPEERVELTKMYVQPDGKPISEETSLLADEQGTTIEEKPTLLEF